jgi:nucleoside-diphosphate-sugar epimerase
LTSVLVTGAAGFVGSALCVNLEQSGYSVFRHIRTPSDTLQNVVLVGALEHDTQCIKALAGIDIIVHTAARVHMMNDLSADPLTEFRRVNRDATLNLARQAAQAGVKRFIFLSSVKAMGESHPVGVPFHAKQETTPLDPYGMSKQEAESGLMELSRVSQMEVVIIRPPLVYGPGVKANFLHLIRLMQKEFPLPFASVQNKRSLVALPNLVDLIQVCLEHPAAANQVFLVSDDQDLSTPELMRRLSKVCAKKSRLFRCHPILLRAIGKVTGKTAVIERLCGDLVVDIMPTKSTLGWKPPVSVDDALMQTVVALNKRH